MCFCLLLFDEKLNTFMILQRRLEDILKEYFCQDVKFTNSMIFSGRQRDVLILAQDQL